MQTIEIKQPRSIIYKKTILFPGPNEVTPELAEEIAKGKGLARFLAKMQRAGIVAMGNAKAIREPAREEGSLAGLSEEQAVRLIEATTDEAQLQAWKKKARGKLAQAIKDQLDFVKLEKGDG
jgi:hypothetical protein